ncbi:MAG: hypothetical protein Q8Q92_01110 [bacterium]|nr:hypothetical protein [bacterium]
MASISKERWFTLSLAEQFGNIGSEVGRAAKWQNMDDNSFWSAVTRAFELFDITQMDTRWKKRRPEIDRARETFADAVLGGREYKSNLKSLEKYFMPFAIAAQMQSLSNAKKAVLDV